MPAPRDRQIPHLLEITQPFPWPLPPLNVSSSSLDTETVDLRWDSPADLSQNSCFSIIGVNIYRSFDSEYGPYFRLNSVPIGTNFWRDQTRMVLSMRENVSGNFTLRGSETDQSGRYVFRTKYRPIIIHPILGSANCTNLNVQVTINNQPAFVQAIFADDGLVELRTTPFFDVTSQTKTNPILPTNQNDVVLATYRYISESVPTKLYQRIFYRVTTVAACQNQIGLIETPLDRATQTNRHEIEKLDYIWREAIRRNKWILYQGGERVKLYIRKTMGSICGCYTETHKQPSQQCEGCFGTGILGGYAGPYDIIIAPSDEERKISQGERGRRLEHSYDSWTGPSPLISQRDFVVKLNGDRYGIGPVKVATNRGAQLQQFFNLEYLDEEDVRYKVPIFDPRVLSAPETRWIQPGAGLANPMVSEKHNIEDNRELRGLTVTYENITY